MGAGGTKVHESFTVAVTAADVAEPLTPTPATASEAEEPNPHLEEPQVVAVDATELPSPWGEDVLTPVVDPPVGLLTGIPLLVGGADLHDSLATLVAYESQAGPREVLVATLAEEAEPKLLEALALSEEKLVPVEVEKEVHGRLPLDVKHDLYGQLVTVAKSVNHHLKAADGIPQHTHESFEKVMAVIGAVTPDAETETDQQMLAHYAAMGEAIAERLTSDYDVPYTEGGKVAPVTPFETSGTVKVTEYLPAPAEDPGPGLLAASVRVATRLAPTVSNVGTASWDGSARSKATGKEYVVDLGDGFSAVYRPYVANDPKKTEYSLRGALEIVAPPGTGHGPQLVTRLGQLNLVNRPMTAAEGEWSYLRRNVWAQRLDTKPGVQAALTEADGLEDAVEHVLFAERAHQAIGMDEAQLHHFAKQLRLEAEAKALPEKVRILRDAVAQVTGFADGQALLGSAGYDPVPKPSGGWLTWGRFDVTADPTSVRKSFGKKGLYHHVTGHNLLDIVRSGVLAATERRALMGIPAGKGMSEHADKFSGGASSVFLRVRSQPSSGPALFWDDPTVLVGRADWYAYNGDHFGAANPQGGHSTHGQTRDPHTVGGFSSGSNEVMIRNGIDLLGAEAPSLVLCGSTSQRVEILTVLADKGITHLRGKPVGEVVK